MFAIRIEDELGVQVRTDPSLVLLARRLAREGRLALHVTLIELDEKQEESVLLPDERAPGMATFLGEGVEESLVAKQGPDFRVSRGGSGVVVFHLLTDAAGAWVDENLILDEWQRRDDHVVVGHLYADQVVAVIRRDGLKVF